MKRQWCASANEQLNEQSNKRLKTSAVLFPLNGRSFSTLTVEEQEQFFEEKKQLLEFYWLSYEMEKEKKNYVSAVHYFSQALKECYFKAITEYNLPADSLQEIDDVPTTPFDNSIDNFRLSLGIRFAS